MSKRSFFILCMSLVLTTSCGQPNVLTEYSNTDSDEALYLDAKNKMDEFDWDGAITIMTTRLSESYRDRTDVKTSLMHAYGGKCGISFFDFVNTLKDVSSTEVFKFTLQLFKEQTVDVEACDNAIATLRTIGATAAERTSDQNLFAAILGLTRMGTTLHARFDTESSGLGDGNADAGWNSCEVSSAAQRLSNDDMNRIVSGLGLIFENLTALGDALTSGSAGTAFDTAKTLCETPLTVPAIGIPHDWDPGIPDTTKWSDLPLDPPLPENPTWESLGFPSDFSDPIDCLNTDESLVSDKMRRIFRRMIASSSMGFGTCDLTSMDVDVDPNRTPIAEVAADCCPTEIQAP